MVWSVDILAWGNLIAHTTVERVDVEHRGNAGEIIC